MKDKLWFFGAFRRAHYDKPIANTFDIAGGREHSGGVQGLPRDAGLRATRASPTRRWTTRWSA